MPHPPDMTTLGFALLGLIQMHPATGYELRRIFQETPMALYSSSPGAIYPALKRLVIGKFVRIRTAIGQTGRNREICHITERGRQSLENWLREPVTEEDVYRRLDLTLLRFSYLDLIDDTNRSLEFLDQFKSGCECCLSRLKSLKQKMAGNQPPHGQFALQNSIDVLQAQLSWAVRTKRHFRKQQNRSTHDVRG